MTKTHTKLAKLEKEVFARAKRMKNPYDIYRTKMKDVIKRDQFLIHGKLVDVVLEPEDIYWHEDERDNALEAMDQGKLNGHTAEVLAKIAPHCKGVGHCAVGALLFAAGVPNALIRQLDNGANSWDHHYYLLLRRTYGVTSDQVGELMGENDQTPGNSDTSIEERREALYEKIDRLRFDPRWTPRDPNDLF